MLSLAHAHAQSLPAHGPCSAPEGQGRSAGGRDLWAADRRPTLPAQARQGRRSEPFWRPLEPHARILEEGLRPPAIDKLARLAGFYWVEAAEPFSAALKGTERLVAPTP